VNFIVVGCGRVGGMLGSLLSTDQHNVTVMEKDPARFENLAPSFSGRRLSVAEYDAEVFSQAGIKDADGVAVVTDSDNENILVAETVRIHFGLQNVVVRIYTPRKMKTFDRLGLRGVCPTALGAYQIYAELLSAKMLSDLPLNQGDFQLLEVPPALVDSSSVLDFERRYQCKIVGARSAKTVIFPWIDQEPQNVTSWIVLATLPHLLALVKDATGRQ
jgi:trk system potassium uptake protein TrkA